MLYEVITLGFWASTGPVELNLIPSHPAQLLVFVGLLLGSTVVFRKPELGLLVLVGLVYSNASEIGVRFHVITSYSIHYTKLYDPLRKWQKDVICFTYYSPSINIMS